MAPTKTTDQWLYEIDSLSYEVEICRQELVMADLEGEDPFILEELRVALRGAQARLDERRRRFAASNTTKARNRARKA
jgi:hypothetical protein